jgi:glutamate/tyrosine decarboxylase-like PLP-dependent enzyme
MENDQDVQDLRKRKAPIEIAPEEFRRLGYQLVDRIADFLSSLPQRPVTPGESVAAVRQALGSENKLPNHGTNPEGLLEQAASLVFDHSLFNSHPRFWGYVTSPAAPIGILGDLLASAVNPNIGSWTLAPMATEIEAQSVRWIAELIGYPRNCEGLLVSGGNMANFVGFLVARANRADWDIRKVGIRHPDAKNLRVYASSETHTWIQKATDLFGLGTDAINWIPVDQYQRMDTQVLRQRLNEDRAQGVTPLLVVGSAGTVSTGAVDPLSEIAAICKEHGAWFHVDGAYGAFAAAAVPAEFEGMQEADSVAVDPHKWLYSPLEAGCILVRHSDALRKTFSYHPPYYAFDKDVLNYFDLGPQNSRGFRALKVWLALRHAGRSGYVQMIGDDIRLAQVLYRKLADHAELEPLTQGLSITTFRYAPAELKVRSDSDRVETYLNRLNEELLNRLEKSGEAFLSKAMLGGKFALRLCIVNFRTSLEDIEALPEIVVRLGRQVDQDLRPGTL